MIDVKRLMIWDKERHVILDWRQPSSGLSIPVIAIRTNGEGDAIIQRGLGESGRILLINLSAMTCAIDPYHSWIDRGLIVVHRWLMGHWDECTDGDSLYTEKILEEAR